MLIEGILSPNFPITKDEFDKYLFHYIFQKRYIGDAFNLDFSKVHIVNSRNFTLQTFDFDCSNSPLTIFNLSNSSKDFSKIQYEYLEKNLGTLNIIPVTQVLANSRAVEITKSDKNKVNIKTFISNIRKGKYKDKLSIEFAQQIDMPSDESSKFYKAFSEIKTYIFEQLPETLHPNNKFDLLSYCEINNMPGINEPQLYIKTTDNWTGYHLEELGMPSVNVCHGPDSSLWIATMDTNIVESLGLTKDYPNKQVFPSVLQCIRNNITIFCGLQKQNDIVITGNNTGHW